MIIIYHPDMTLPTPPASILIVDDDHGIRTLLADYLERHGYRARGCGDGDAMWRILAASPPDLLILDLNLPGDDGVALCRKLRPRWSLPIIMLTARGTTGDRVLGLETGADDYITKPFEPRELLARVRNIIGRNRLSAPRVDAFVDEDQLHFPGWTLDLNARHLIDAQGIVIMLSSVEFQLLRLFLEHPNRVLSRNQLLELSRGRVHNPFDRAIDIQICRLRQKLGDDARLPTMIKTVRNGGYVFAQQVKRGTQPGALPSEKRIQ
ncbi:response regulator transcription factor [Rugamonas sp.]|uniref:response regulator n=1 Tax=Rugamonas sp. TaxID=1926287 RepID=UPI0025D65E2E|nr:response regulator transcription factor [Rugamonas sp.]